MWLEPWTMPAWQYWDLTLGITYLTNMSDVTYLFK